MPKLNLNLPKKPVGRPRKDAIQYDKAEAFDLTKKLNAGNIAESMMSSLFKVPAKRGRPPKTSKTAQTVEINPMKKEAPITPPSATTITKRSVRPKAEKIEKAPKKQTQAYLDLSSKEKEMVDILNEPISKGSDFDTAVKNKYDKLVKWHGTTDINSIESSMKHFFLFLSNKSVADKMFQLLSFDVIDKTDNEFIKQQLDSPFKFNLTAETYARFNKLLNYAKIKTVADYVDRSNLIGHLIGKMSQHADLESELRILENKMNDQVEDFKSKESIKNVFEKVRNERKSELKQKKYDAKKQM